MTPAPPIQVPTSRARLLGLGVCAAVCTAACGISALVFAPELPLLALAALVLTLLFSGWLVAAIVALRLMPPVAYSFSADGLFFGEGGEPAFGWHEVAGATLVRGKRRSAVALILKNGVSPRTRGPLPDWLASLLGRPTDPDVALTPMDTPWALGPFLDLIQRHLDTYGQIRLEKSQTS